MVGWGGESPMSQVVIENPVINSSFNEPGRHFRFSDKDEQLRWLASLSLQGIGGGTVIATLKAFIEQAPSAVAREEAEKLLGKLMEGSA